MENAKQEVSRMKIATVYGIAEVAADEFYNHTILMTTETHTLVIDGEPVVLPAGTFYLRNRELARRTEKRAEGQAEYILVRGIYDLWRLCDHVQKGTRMEARELAPHLRDIRACAEALLVGGALTEEEYEQIARMLTITAQEFQEPKRAPRKLATGNHLRKARTIGTEARADRRRIAPSSMIAYAAGYQVDRRIKDVWSINGHFNARSTRIYFHIQSIHEKVEEYWRFLCGHTRAGGKRLLAKRSEMRELFFLLADERRGKNALVMLRKRLLAHRGAFLGIAAQPYVGLAQAIVKRTERLAFLAGSGDRERMVKVGGEIRRLLRRMRMIHHLETRVVSPLAFYLQRVSPAKRSEADVLPRLFRMRLQETSLRLQTFGAKDIRAELKAALLVAFQTAEESFATGDFSRAKEYVKDATRLLADTAAGRAVPPVP